MAEHDPPASGACQSTTKKGGPCPYAAEAPSRYCWRHDPARREEARAKYRSLGQRGAEAKHQRERERATAVAVGLGDAGSIRAALERALSLVEASDVGPVERANATARICATALRLLEVADLAAQLEELRLKVEGLSPRRAA
jgi:hypothetical protein